MKFNYEELMKQVKNEAEYSVLMTMIPDKDSKNLFTMLLSPFMDRGIEVSVALEILTDMSKNFEHFKKGGD